MNQLESLNCPNCGGEVISDRTRCEFCGSQLKTVGCSSCLGMMFLGSKFCGHCGAEANDIVVDAASRPGSCPRCEIVLRSLEIGSVSISECERCGGFWCGIQTFESLCVSKEKQASVLGVIENRKTIGRRPAAIKYVPCPDCGDLMNRSNFARISGVIIDMCRGHGVWFDADELPRIIEFIELGGMSRAREKERIQLDDERSRIRDEQRKLALMAQRSGDSRSGDESFGSGFGSIISRLFDL